MSSTRNNNNTNGDPEKQIVQIRRESSFGWDSEDESDKYKRSKLVISRNEHFPAHKDNYTSPINPIREVNLSMYQQRKLVAQGMLDIALFSANANQLRYVIESPSHPYYYVNLVFLSISLFLQILVGIGLVLSSKYDPQKELKSGHSEKIAFLTIAGIYMITVVNVFIAAFGVAHAQVLPMPHNSTSS